MPRPKKNVDGTVVASTPKDPGVVLEALTARVANWALLHNVSLHTVTNLLTTKFETEQEAVIKEQKRQLLEVLSVEELQALIAQAAEARKTA